MIAIASFLESRDFLLAHRADYEVSREGFVWPRQTHFNWALDYFDPMAVGNENTALWIVEESGEECRLSFAALAPVYVAAHGAGMWRALALLARERVRRVSSR